MDLGTGCDGVLLGKPQDKEMERFFFHAVILLAGWCVLGAPARGQDQLGRGQPGLNAARWPAERVELVDGQRYQGLIESEDDAWVHLILIGRPRGRPMSLVIRTFDRASVASVSRLGPDERLKVRQQIDQFRNRARIEAGRMEAVRLDLHTMQGEPYHHYRGRWFNLQSNADESTTRRIIVRVEQIFTAYRQILAPRTEPKRPLRLVVLRSMEEYHAYLARLGLKIRGPACFIQEQNLVVAGSELARYAAEMAKVKGQHDQLRADLERLEQELPARLEKIGRRLREEGAPKSEIARLLIRERRRFEKQIEGKRNELARCDRENARAFQNITQQMFAQLYHEAFHAFLENYVYPSGTYDVPRWLNEGLAVVFEGGLLESETLRVDAPNRAALQRLQADLGSPDPLPLETLLAAGQGAFVHDHDADRHYAYSWGLAYYLTFQNRLLTTPALEQYARRSAKDLSPTQRFEKLVGMPVARFEKGWREYILELH